MKSTLLAAVFLVGAAMLFQVPWRGIDPDELEHVHAACAVSWGEMPYRDFFEHHAPALSYLLQPILHVAGPELPALWWSRLAMWAAAAATLAVTAAIARRLGGTKAALAAPTLLACTTIFFQKAVEVRPDVPAMLLLALATYVAVSPANRRSFTVKGDSPIFVDTKIGPVPRSAAAAVFVGLLLGMATLFTQKAIVPAAALIFSQWAVSPSRYKNAILSVSALAATWLAAAGLFWTAGAAWVFLDATICQLWRWPLRLNPLETLRPTLAADLTIWIAAAAAVGSGLWAVVCCQLSVVSYQWSIKALSPLPSPLSSSNPQSLIPNPSDSCSHSDPFPQGERYVLLLTVSISFVGGLFIKAAYAQYYLLWFPLAAAVAADWLVRSAGIECWPANRPFSLWESATNRPLSLWERVRVRAIGEKTQTSQNQSALSSPDAPNSMGEERHFKTGPERLPLLGIVTALFAAEMFLAGRAIRQGTDGPLPHLAHCFSVLSLSLLAGTILAAIAVAAGNCVWRGRRAGAVLSLAALGLGYAGLRNLDALCWSNRDQVAAIERVCRLVGPQETVFDGYTGLGAFRRHAYYYWWLNPYSLRLLTPAAQGEELLASLKRLPPKVICLDKNIRGLSPAVLVWIEQNYRPIKPPLYERIRP